MCLHQSGRQIRQCTREASDPATIAKLGAAVLVRAKPSPSLLTERERAGSPDEYTRHALHVYGADPSQGMSVRRTYERPL